MVNEETGIVTLMVGNKAVICKVFANEIKNMIEFAPKDGLTVPQIIKNFKNN